jgi:hypothetical protein
MSTKQQCGAWMASPITPAPPHARAALQVRARIRQKGLVPFRMCAL